MLKDKAVLRLWYQKIRRYRTVFNQFDCSRLSETVSLGDRNISVRLWSMQRFTQTERMQSYLQANDFAGNRRNQETSLQSQ